MFLGGSYISEAVHTQLMLFLAAMVWGAAVALAYDGLRVARHIWPPPGWLYLTEDVLFWIVEALMIYRLMFIYDDGAIRSYTMLGMILGMALYLWAFGRWLSKAVGKLLDAVLKACKKCLRCIFHVFGILLKPFRWIIGKLWKIAVKKSGFLKKYVNSTTKLLKKKPKKGRMGIINNNSE